MQLPPPSRPTLPLGGNLPHNKIINLAQIICKQIPNKITAFRHPQFTESLSEFTAGNQDEGDNY